MDKYDLIAEEQSKNDWIEKEMCEQKEEALRKLSTFVAHSNNPNLLKEFALTLTYGWQEGCQPAQILASHLDLSAIDFFAIQEDFELFKESYLRDYEQAANFA